MSPLERDLKESLKRREPPAGFADRVIARAHAPEKRPATWRLLAVAAMVVVLIGGGHFVQEQRRQAETQRRKEQLMTALRITGSKLQRVHDRLSRIQERIDQNLEQ